jgi:hypothetical protein
MSATENLATILGAGPSGLLAALAAAQRGYDIEILADGEPSPVSGAQYLHAPVPGLTEDHEPTMLTYVKVGDMDGYAQKAYGEPAAQVSWDTFVTGEYPAWNLRKAYEELWYRFESRIHKRHLEVTDIDLICNGTDGPVFSSIPLKSICKDALAHDFQGQRVVFTEEEYVKVPEMIVYNGRLSDAWYRAACLFGYSSTEYALAGDGLTQGTAYEIKENLVVFDGIKPTMNHCNCFTKYQNFHKIGRFGQWRRGILTNHAYEEVAAAL